MKMVNGLAIQLVNYVTSNFLAEQCQQQACVRAQEGL
jgi:hypothetical protein